MKCWSQTAEPEQGLWQGTASVGSNLATEIASWICACALLSSFVIVTAAMARDKFAACSTDAQSSAQARSDKITRLKVDPCHIWYTAGELYQGTVGKVMGKGAGVFNAFFPPSLLVLG